LDGEWDNEEAESASRGDEMMYAVTIEPLHMTIFLAERPEAGPWKIEEDVDLENIPDDLDIWPEGEKRPEQVLCRSTSDGKNHYKVFKYSRDIDRSKFEPTGNNFLGVYYSKTDWDRLRKIVLSELAIQAIPDDDPPELMDEAIRNLREAR
jgi:hypothetical protein